MVFRRAAHLFALAPLLLTAAAAARQCPLEWSAEFPANNIQMNVHAWAAFDDGSGPAVYAAGSNGVSGGNLTIARWTTTGWARVGDGTNGTVYALKVFDD